MQLDRMGSAIKHATVSGAVANILLCDLRARMGFLLENLYYYIQVKHCFQVHALLHFLNPLSG